MPFWIITLALLVAASLPARGEVRSDFNADNRLWTLTNSRIEARFELNPAGFFRFAGLKNLRSGSEWLPAMPGNSSPINLKVDNDRWGPQTSFQLVSH